MNQSSDGGIAAKPVILVVENEPILRMDTADVVEDLGYKALEAIHADEALRVLERRTDVGVVVTDIDMPGTWNGLQFARRVRERWPRMGIVLVSGRYSVRREEMPERSVFFHKPINHELFAATLQRMVEAQQP